MRHFSAPKPKTRRRLDRPPSRNDAKEIQHFVSSGQRSIVERYLVDAEVKEADTKIAEYAERVRTMEERLAIELGVPSGGSVACMGLDKVESAIQKLAASLAPTPSLRARKPECESRRRALPRPRLSLCRPS